MPRHINVKRVIENPLFTTSFIVHRKKATWLGGRPMVQESDLQFSGVISVTSPKELQQFPEADRIRGMITILSTQELYTTTSFDTDNQFLSDVVEYKARHYKIVDVNAWIDFGYYRAHAVYMEGN